MNAQPRGFVTDWPPASRAMLVEAWNVCHRPLADLNTPIGVNAYEKSEKA
jgi:hypothetical protein